MPQTDRTQRKLRPGAVKAPSRASEQPSDVTGGGGWEHRGRTTGIRWQRSETTGQLRLPAMNHCLLQQPRRGPAAPLDPWGQAEAEVEAAFRRSRMGTRLGWCRLAVYRNKVDRSGKCTPHTSCTFPSTMRAQSAATIRRSTGLGRSGPWAASRPSNLNRRRRSQRLHDTASMDTGAELAGDLAQCDHARRDRRHGPRLPEAGEGIETPGSPSRWISICPPAPLRYRTFRASPLATRGWGVDELVTIQLASGCACEPSGPPGAAWTNRWVLVSPEAQWARSSRPWA